MHFFSKLYFPKIFGFFLFVALTPVFVVPSMAHAPNNKTGGDKIMSVTDIMKFREIKNTKISEDGKWIAYSAEPDRGAITGHVQSSDGKVKYDVVEGTNPAFSNDGNWVMFSKAVSLFEKESASKDDKKKLKTGLVVINLNNGEQKTFKRVKAAQISGDSKYVGISYVAPEKKNEKKNGDENAKENAKENGDSVEHFLDPKSVGTPFELIELATGNITIVANVQKFTFSKYGPHLTYSVVNKAGKGNKLVTRDLATGTEIILSQDNFGSFPHMSWSEKGDMLAFIKGSYLERTTTRQHYLYTFKAGEKAARQTKTARGDWFISHDNKLTWSKDGKRLFFGQKPEKTPVNEVDTKVETYDDLFDVEKITAKRELQVWHGDDPRIKPQEKVQYKNDLKQVWISVYHPKGSKFVALADEDIPTVNPTENPHAVLAFSNMPYQKDMTWDGFYNDAYHVSLKTGKRQLFAKRLPQSRNQSLSPTGRYVAFYKDQAYWVFDSKKGTTVNITENIGVPMGNELHDYPSDVPGYGIAGWVAKDQAVLIYDRYDIWSISPDGKATNLTEAAGRRDKTIYRLIKTDPDQLFFKVDDYQLVKAYNDVNKEHGFYHMTLNQGTLEQIIWGKKTYKFVKKAKKSDEIVFTREDLKEFPDLWLANASKSHVLDSHRKLTDVNPQLADFAIGEPMLVNWRSTMGKDLQGVLIKPANYVEGQKYPVLVYYYRYSSQRLYNFNQMKVNHRPNFPYYTSNGYAVFLPDIIFKEGAPGPSATAALVPGIEKIVDLGIADRDKIGLHGHSWSGYQTAYVVTETDIFAAAVSGAPVSNMTSAYTGIRLGSGLARMFQYEKTQSRIGATLYDKPHLYIENSPIFFTDRINTPMLIQHGDADDAVPWEQSIEMYLAMRRLGKPVVFLQYEGEPHHLKKYPNKVDYTLKMKHYFDHYLKGVPAEKWITEGEAFSKPDPEKPQNSQSEKDAQ